ncbi:MAG: ABC transporter ATP-binding protein [Desulfamplus sp.]|nr:ABC transporter ATP-binding protein [Desulfamplus sp.]
MLGLENITQSYPAGFRTRQTVLSSLSWHLSEGGITGLVGQSGCGKSTLARIILGLERPEKGRVTLYGKDIWKMDSKERKNFCRTVQLVPQHPDAAFNPRLTIGTSLKEVFRFHDICPQNRQHEYLQATLAHVRMPEELLERYPAQLSGGELQRLAIARAILTKPSLLVLDEVTSMLDVSVQAAVIQTLRELHREHGAAYLFITHNISLARVFCQKRYILENGTLKRYER